MLSLQSTGTCLQLPDAAKQSLWLDGGNHDEKRKASPVWSRSESPLSDTKNAGFGRFSAQFYGKSRTDLPYTDSDGLYDYPSSERSVFPSINIPRRHTRKCDLKRRERRNSLKPCRTETSGEFSLKISDEIFTLIKGLN